MPPNLLAKPVALLGVPSFDLNEPRSALDVLDARRALPAGCLGENRARNGDTPGLLAKERAVLLMMYVFLADPLGCACRPSARASENGAWMANHSGTWRVSEPWS